MCGPTKQEKELQGSSEGFSNTLQANYGTQFKEQQSTLADLNNTISQIKSGNTGQGFGPQELAAKSTQILNAGAAANANARRAAQNFGAGQGGGGGNGLTSGIMKQVQGEIASNSANQIAGAQENLTAANYQQGRENAVRAASGYEALAQGYSPNSSMSGAINENAESFGEAKTIEEQQAAKDQAIASGITSAAFGAATFGAGALGGGGLQGGLQALSGSKNG